VQEIDIPTGLVLFQWDSLDHVPVSDTYITVPRSPKALFDYFHVNSIDVDKDGNLIISSRNTWAAYKVDYPTGAVIWRLGGKHSSFRLAPGTYWAFQHDVRARASNDLFVTLFDNGGGPPIEHGQSRGIKLILDLRHMRARQVADHLHSPAVLSLNEGNFQQLPNRDDFLGWGDTPYFNQYDSRGRLILAGQFVDANSNYRSYRFPWTGTPTTPPAVAGTNTGRRTAVYASWNGATNVASWLVLGGASASALRVVGGGRRTGFETQITVSSQRYVAVQARDWTGHPIGQSNTVRVG
jgi:hypothetical protein